MVSRNVDQVFKAAQALNDAERDELRKLLDMRASRAAAASTNEHVRNAMVARGLLDPIPPQGKDPVQFKRWQPIPIVGPPLSQTIVEERR